MTRRTDCGDTPGMLPMREARARVLSAIDALPALGRERVWLGDALGRVLDEPVYARRDQPPMANSAMDGYALRGAELRAGASFEVVGESAAGRPATRAVASGEAIRIFTGAAMPEGADTVVMQEICERDGTRVTVREAREIGSNVRPAGDDVKAGAQVLAAGATLGPAEIGILATVGRSSLRVRLRPRVALLSSGDELTEIDTPPESSQIISSNDHALAAAVREAGAIPLRLGIAEDNEAAIASALEEALRCDALVSSGGVSVGDHDLMRPALEAQGYVESFWRVAIKPGKPFAFGLAHGRPCFGLPGNPISTLVTFELFARPALLRMQGHQAVLRPQLRARYEGAEALRGTRARTSFLRGTLTQTDAGGYTVTAPSRQGSGQLSAMAAANALIEVPAGAAPITPGSDVQVQLIRAFTL